MPEVKKDVIFINQPVNKKVYNVIKSIAALEEKNIKDVVNDAFVFYVKSKGLKK